MTTKLQTIFALGILLILPLHATIASAQSKSPYDDSRIVEFRDNMDLETAHTEVVYEMTATDPLLNDMQEVDRMVLLIGPRYSKYEDYTGMLEKLALRREGYKMTRGRWHFISDSVGAMGRTRILYKDRQENKCREVGFAFGTYSYDDELPEVDWQLTEGEKELGGYLCRSAECDLHGRHWSVWYAPEIKISEGPYKLMGLPGLILEAHSKDGEIDLDFVSLSKSTDPIVYDKEQYENSFKGSRKDFYRAISRAKWNTNQAMSSQGLWATDMDGNPIEPVNKYMFYVPMEMDLVERPKE